MFWYIRFCLKSCLACLNSDFDKLDINESESITTSWNSLESKVDKLDVDKEIPVSAYLNKLSDVVNNEVIKKDVYDKLVKKVNAINN